MKNVHISQVSSECMLTTKPFYHIFYDAIKAALLPFFKHAYIFALQRICMTTMHTHPNACFHLCTVTVLRHIEIVEHKRTVRYGDIYDAGRWLSSIKCFPVINSDPVITIISSPRKRYLCF